MRVLVSVVVASSLGSSVASADQCAIVDPQVASRAAELARKSTAVIEYCEPCRGGSQRGPFAIGKVFVRDRQVEINGVAVDLAYTFIHTKGGEYANLAVASGCPARGVSRTLRSTRTPQDPPAPPPYRVPPPRPARIATADELGGTWEVTVRANVTSCSALPANHTATWTIVVAGGTFSLLTDAGRELVGAVPPLDHQLLRVTLQDRQQPRASALQINQSVAAHFYGRLVQVERDRGQSCATVYDVMANRVTR